MSSDQKHVKKRGGTFSRKQLTIIQQYLQTGELPSKESLLDISFLSNGRSGRFKTICRRFVLVDDKVTHVSGKSIVPKEDFICEIAKAHQGETGEPHLNFEKTLKKLTEMFTVGKRTYGMSKKLIEAVVKACNTGSCCKEKKTKKKKEYDDAVKKYARKCSVNKSASTAVKNNVEKTKMTKATDKKVKKHAPNKGKSTAHTIIKCGPKIKKDKKMSTLVQMLNKLVVTPSTVTTSQPDTITIGPFPVSVVKSVSGSSQYQLVLPILNQQLTSSQNTVYTNTTVLKLPITCMNISTASNRSGLVQHETPGNFTGNTTKIPPLPVNMSFTTLLQSVARNSLASSNTQISSSTCNPPAPTEKLQDRSPSSTNGISDNSLKPPDMIINIPVDTGKTPSLKVLLKQAIKNQSIKYSRSATSTQEPPKKKSKTVKQILTCKNKLETVNTSKERVVKEDGDCFFVAKEGGDNDKSNNNCNHDSKSCIDDNREFDEDWSDEDYKALELIKNCGIYRNCLKCLTELPMEDFNMVMDRMTTNIFSEGPNPYSVPFSTVTDLPFPHLWYFPHEIRQEENIFLRIMMVMKDIRIDMTRSMMQEHGALDRLKKKIMYVQNMIKRDKVFLDTGVTKSMKQMKKEADIKPIHRRKQCLTPKTS